MERFYVKYRILAKSEKEALNRAEAIALEQTVEISRDIVPEGYIENEILGKVEDLSFEDTGQYTAIISYSPDSTSDELPQLINVIFGNSSLVRGVKVTGVKFGPEMQSRFPGAKFGIKGIREKINKPDGGMICPVIKPQGLSVDELEAMAYSYALAGAELIKDDHGITNQPMAPFRERCERVAAAVAKANIETGGNTLYFTNIAGHIHDLIEDARFAQDAGAGGVLVMPGLLGFGLVHSLSKNPDFNLPIMTHPTFLGPYVLSEDTGLSHAMVFATLQRLAGADIAIFPMLGGRLGFSEAECQSIADACQSEDGPGQPIIPAPGGGMSAERAPEMKRLYGNDVAYPIGGSLLRYKDRVKEGIQEIQNALRN